MQAYQYFLRVGKVLGRVRAGTMGFDRKKGHLHETTTRNDISLRKVILGGTPGHRTVQVPAWHGIDPEP